MIPLKKLRRPGPCVTYIYKSIVEYHFKGNMSERSLEKICPDLVLDKQDKNINAKHEKM